VNAEDFQKSMDALELQRTGKPVRRAIVERHGEEYQLVYDGACSGIYKTVEGAKKCARRLTPTSKGKLRWNQTMRGTWEARID
jgi:hypothetical protein